MRYFVKLDVWKRAHQLVLKIYRLTGGYPESERYGLASQTRRAAVSIASNIAEGSGRHGRADYARFLDIAVASCSELEYQLMLAGDLAYSDSGAVPVLQDECREVRAMLLGLKRAILGEPAELPLTED